MNMLGTYENLISQGPVFWAASAAVAAGLTLLLISVALQLRKLFSKSRGNGAVVSWRTSLFKKNNTSAEPEILITDTGYGLGGKYPQVKVEDSKNPVIPISSDPSIELVGLLQRLREAGDQLEVIQKASVERPTTNGNSFLKPHSHPVEYLNRTGVS